MRQVTLILSFLIGLGIYLAGSTHLLEGLELRAYDQLFRVRHAAFGAQEIDDRILLVGIDKQSVEQVGLPNILWQQVYAEVFLRLKEAGVAVAALDAIFAPVTTNLPDDAPLADQLFEEGLLMGEVVSQGPFLLIELLHEDGTTTSPADLLKTMALRPASGDGSNLVVANIVQDADGVCRRIAAYRELDPDSEFKGRYRTLYLRMLELLTGRQVTREGDDLKLGDERIPVGEGHALRLNYPAPVPKSAPSAFPYVSLKDVLDGNVPHESLAGKVCIIAPVDAAFQDFTATPYNAQALGVETHLSALNTVLTESFIVKPAGVWPLLILLAALLAGQLGLHLDPSKAGLWLVGGAGGYLVLALLAFSFSGVWLPLASVLLAGAGGAAVGYAQRLSTIERDRAQIRSTFGRMVSPQVMKHVLESPEALASGRRKEITVLFSDINNFTPICEKHTPEEIIGMLSDYFRLMVDVILRHDGYIKQYVGDEIMVIFGAPDEQTDHAARAVKCGVEIIEELQKAADAATGPGFYDTKVGINTGSVVVGKVGPEDRWEYAAVGDDVNLGARVMGLTKTLDTKILVSENTRRAVGERLPEVEWVSYGPQSFKGKEQRMEVFEVRRKQATPS